MQLVLGEDDDASELGEWLQSLIAWIVAPLGFTSD
jgi:hypothetical protein